MIQDEEQRAWELEQEIALMQGEGHQWSSGRCLVQSLHLGPTQKPQELYQLFEKYARSEELHQRKVESQRKPKDPPQSRKPWTRPAQPDSDQDNLNHQ
jgi:hypothetical protein